jgi:hypothetical protein
MKVMHVSVVVLLLGVSACSSPDSEMKKAARCVVMAEQELRKMAHPLSEDPRIISPGAMEYFNLTTAHYKAVMDKHCNPNDKKCYLKPIKEANEELRKDLEVFNNTSNVGAMRNWFNLELEEYCGNAVKNIQEASKPKHTPEITKDASNSVLENTASSGNTDPSKGVVETVVGGPASEDCAVITGGHKYCYKDRVSKYFLHDGSPDYQRRFSERIEREVGASETEELIRYSVDQASLCRRYDRAASDFCDIITDHSVEIEDVNVMFYRAMVFFEGLPGNDFEGKVITEHRPIFDQREVIDWYFKNYAGNDVDYHPDVAKLRDTWRSGKSKYSDYEYYLATHGKCMADSETLEQDYDICEEMTLAVEDQIRQNKKANIHIVADWHYIAAIYQKQ